MIPRLSLNIQSIINVPLRAEEVLSLVPLWVEFTQAAGLALDSYGAYLTMCSALYISVYDFNELVTILPVLYWNIVILASLYNLFFYYVYMLFLLFVYVACDTD